MKSPEKGYALVLNAPHYRVGVDGRRSFDATLKSGVGTGFALNQTILPKALLTKQVILLDKTKHRMARGTITRIEKTGVVTDNGIPRFDIHMTDLRPCNYMDIPLNRNGVAIQEI